MSCFSLWWKSWRFRVFLKFKKIQAETNVPPMWWFSNFCPNLSHRRVRPKNSHSQSAPAFYFEIKYIGSEVLMEFVFRVQGIDTVLVLGPSFKSFLQCILILIHFQSQTQFYPQLVLLSLWPIVYVYCMCVFPAPMPWHQMWPLKRRHVLRSSSSQMDSSSRERLPAWRLTRGSSEVLP